MPKTQKPAPSVGQSNEKTKFLATALSLSVAAVPSLAQETALAPIVVEGDPEVVTEGTETYSWNRVTVGGKQPQRNRDIPQTVSVLTREVLDNFGATSIEDASRLLPNLNEATGDGFSGSLYTRGQEVFQYYVDGAPRPFLSIYGTAPDLFFFDRLEVMYGPSGVFQGSGEPVGTINLVRKRPTDTFQALGGIAGDTEGGYRLEGDVSGPMNEAGTVRGRLAAYGEHENSFTDFAEQDQAGVFGTIDIDIGDATTLSFGGIAEQTDAVRFAGLPTFTNGRLLDDEPRSTFIGSDENEADIENWEVFAEVEHRFDYGGVLKATGRFFDQDATLRTLFANSPVMPVTRDFNVFWFARDFEQEASYFDINLTSPFAVQGRAAEVVAGVDYRRVDQSFKQNFDFSPGQVNLDTFNPRAFDQPVFTFPGVGPGFVLNTESTVEEWGIYAQARFEVTDRLKFNLGGRYSIYEARSEDTGRNIVTENNENNFAPYVGVTYDLTDTVTAYASYAEIFQPQSETDATGAVLKPRTGRQAEVGAKYESLDGALTAQAAYFYIRDENRAQEDPVNVGSFVAAAEAETQGFEVLVSGQVLPGFEIITGYAYVDTDLETDPTSPQNFTLFGKYSFDTGPAEGLSLGGGIRAASSFEVISEGVKIEAPSYAVVDLFAAYAFNERTELRLNIENLFDKKYVTRINTPSRGTFFGQPLTATLALNATF